MHGLRVKNYTGRSFDNMKVIDFHAHIFNDKIAHLAIANLENHYKMPWQCKGTLEDMRENIKNSGFYRAVIFSTPTKPTQTVINNDFLFNIKDEEFIVFGSVHPDYEDVKGEIKRIKQHALRGFKFHPDFQRFNIDDDKALRMYEEIGSEYPIVLHVGDKELDFSAPERLSRVLEIFPEHKFVAAHMGGYSVWETGAKYLLGENVWIDTSSSMWNLDFEKMAQIIKQHGADKVLFGTDYPAVDLKWEYERFCSIPISEEDKEKILFKNAAELLNLK